MKMKDSPEQKNKQENENKQPRVKDVKGTFKKLLGYLGRYKFLLIFAVIVSIISSIFSVLGPKFLGDGTTIIYEGVMNIISDNGKGMDFTAIRNIVFILIGVYGISAAFAYLEGFLLNEVSMRVTYNLRKAVSEKINKLPLKYFDKKKQGEVLSYITNDIDTISWNLDQTISNVLTAIVIIIGIATMMFIISWQMTIAAFLIIPVSLFFIVSIIKKSQTLFKKQQNYLSDLNGYIEEIYTNHTIVKSFNGSKDSVEKCNEYNERLYNVAWKAQFLSGLIQPIMRFVSNLGYVAVCILGGYLASIGTITVRKHTIIHSIYEKIYSASYTSCKHIKHNTINTCSS